MVSDEINLILASVSSITEIPPEDILSKSKQSDIVDSRYIVVKILYNKGYSISRISKVFNISGTGVRNIIQLSDDRLKYNKLLYRFYKEASNILDAKT